MLPLSMDPAVLPVRLGRLFEITSMRRPFFALLATLLIMPMTRMIAQDTPAAPARLVASGRPANVISVNPILPLAGYFQGEYERRVRDNLAFALGFSHIELDEIYTNVDAKLRLYPQEKAPHGLGLAAGLGVGHIRQDSYYDYTGCAALPGTVCPPATRRSTTAPSFSVEIHYQWLLGKRRNTAVGFGFGAKRYFISNNDNGYGGDLFQPFVPTGRLTIGWAFP